MRTHLKTALNHLETQDREIILEEFNKIDLALKWRTYWRLETVASSLQPMDPNDYLFYFPILKNDSQKILEFHEPATKLPTKYLEDKL